MSAAPDPYALLYPITTTLRVGGQDRDETVSEVSLRRMNAGDLRLMDTVKGDMNKALTLLARLSGLDQRTIDKIDAEDLTNLSAIIEGFMPAGLKTGETS